MAVSLTRAKPIGTLYEEVAAYDLVLVPDQPYALGLNRHLDAPHVGHFATTPRQYVAGDRDGRDDRDAFLTLIDRLDLPWKQTAHLIGEVLQCWEHQGTPDAILAYDRYDTPAVRSVIDEITDIDTTAKRLQEESIGAGTSVAVVGKDQLTPLQRSILPANVDEIDPFLDETRERPDFRLVDSASAMIGQLQATVQRNDPNDIAVVIEEGSRYNTLVESAFDAAAIPYHGGPEFADMPEHRAFLRLLRLAHAGSAITVGEVRPVLARMDVVPPIEHDDKRLVSLSLEEARWIEDRLASIPTTPVGETLDEFEQVTGDSFQELRGELDTLGLLDETASQSTVDRLTFYLQSFDVPTDREDSGVVLASATNAAYVDRPLVIFLALDQGWTRDAPARPWIDEDQFLTRDLNRFELLLQSGTTQQYLVQDIVGGEPVIPCLYLDAILDERIDRFRDLGVGDKIRPFRHGGDGFDISDTTSDPPKIGTISQSSLNTFVHSPRDYLFGRLVDSPEAIPLEEGILLHDFAEFAIDHPSTLSEATIAEAVDLIAEELSPFYSDADLEVRRTTYHAWCSALAAYAREVADQSPTSQVGRPSKGTNPFAERFDRPIEGNRTERRFEDPDLGINGKIDLVNRDDALVDFKRSARRTSGSIVRSSAIDPPDDSPNYQAPLYLTYLRKHRPKQPLTFSFLYLKELIEGVFTEDLHLEEGMTTIGYHPVPFETYIASDTAYRSLIEESSKKSRKTFEQVSFDTYREFWDGCDDSLLEDELNSDPLRSALEATLIDEVGEYKYVKKGTGQALRYLDKIRSRNFFADDIDDFEDFVEDRLDELNRYLANEERFPVRHLVEELNDRRLNHPDLLLDHA